MDKVFLVKCIEKVIGIKGFNVLFVGVKER